MKRVAVVTGTRADYGLLRGLMRQIDMHPDLMLLTIATGSHLVPEFGRTVDVIASDGFGIDARVDMLLGSGTSTGVITSMGVGLIGFASTLEYLAPDILVLLGDRYETWVAAAAATVARIPIAHIHGGETTEGAMDEAIRHGITKMSHIHFVAADEYRRRVIQLGEQPDSVHQVGALGLDGICEMDLLSRGEIERELQVSFRENSILVTLHPETLSAKSASEHVQMLLSALDELEETTLIFTSSNADPESSQISRAIDEYCELNANAWSFKSLGQQRYLSCIAAVDAVVGNSSSGIIEAPALGTPTLNIGRRQQGRLRAKSVVDCDFDVSSIAAGLRTVLAPGYRDRIGPVSNPYGSPGAGAKIVSVLVHADLAGVLQKRFFDLPVVT